MGLCWGRFGAMLPQLSIIWSLVGKFAQKAKILKKCCTVVDFGGFEGPKLGLCWAMLALRWAKLGHLGGVCSHLQHHVG